MLFWGYMIIFLLLPFDFGYGKAWAKNEIKPVEENLSIKNTTQRSLKFSFAFINLGFDFLIRVVNS